MNSKPGPKKDKGVFSGLRPEHETWDEIRLRIIHGSAEWPLVALQKLIKSGTTASDLRLDPYLPLWNNLRVQFDQAVVGGDADWFERQAKAIRKGGSPTRAKFNAKVVLLLERVHMDTIARQCWKDGQSVLLLDYPDFRPAGHSAEATARDIFNALEKSSLPDGLLLVEGWEFEKKERVMDAIHDLARRLQFELQKQTRANR